MLKNKQIKRLNLKAFKQCKHKELFKRIKFNLVAKNNPIGLHEVGIFKVLGIGNIIKKHTITLDKILSLSDTYIFISKYFKIDQNKIYYSNGLFYIV